MGRDHERSGAVVQPVRTLARTEEARREEPTCATNPRVGRLYTVIEHMHEHPRCSQIVGWPPMVVARIEQIAHVAVPHISWRHRRVLQRAEG